MYLNKPGSGQLMVSGTNEFAPNFIIFLNIQFSFPSNYIGTMNLQKSTLFDLIFLFVVFIMGMLSIFSYQRIMDLDRKADYITHTSIVKLKLEQLLSHIKDAESRQRGFLLTGDSSHFEQYSSSLQFHEMILDDIDSLLTDNKAQQDNK